MATINLGRVKGSMWYTGTVDGNTSIAAALTEAGIIPLKLDMYMNTANGNVYQYRLVSDNLTWILCSCIMGPDGKGFAIAKVYSSIASMNSGFANDGLDEGSFVIIETGDVDNADNSKMYVKGATSYEFVTDLSGSQGIQGPAGKDGVQGGNGADGVGITRVEISTGLLTDSGQTYTLTVVKTDGSTSSVTFVAPKGSTGDDGADGAAATVQVGSTTTGAAGSNASVINVGTQNAAVLNFTIPRGATGAAGKDGTDGVSATVQVGTVTTGAAGSNVIVTNTGASANNAVFNFTIPRGNTGATGAAGADGKTPTLAINSNGELVATYE